MIRELDRREIEKTLDHIIKSYSHDKEYQYWFNNEIEIQQPNRAFLIGDGSYYVDIDRVHDVNTFGILRLRDTNKPFISDMVELMNRCIKEYGVLACFRDVNHKQVATLWKYLERKCNVITEEIQVSNVIVKIFYEKE